jgi:hypothetical protein
LGINAENWEEDKSKFSEFYGFSMPYSKKEIVADLKECGKILKDQKKKPKELTAWVETNQPLE